MKQFKYSLLEIRAPAGWRFLKMGDLFKYGDAYWTMKEDIEILRPNWYRNYCGNQCLRDFPWFTKDDKTWHGALRKL